MIQRRKIIFLKISILFLLLIILFVWYVNQFILPKKVRGFFVETLKVQTNRDVSVKDIHYNIFKGIVIKNLVIYDNPQITGRREFLNIERLSFNFLYFPIFKERKVFIPAIYIYNPHLSIEMQSDGIWNFSDMPFLQDLSRPKKAKQKFDFIVRKINVQDAKIAFKDNTTIPAFSKEILAKEIRLFLALPAAVKFKSLFEIKNGQNNPAQIRISGEIFPFKKYASLDFSGKEVSLTEYSAYYREFLPVKILSGISDVRIETVLKNNNLTGVLKSDINQLKIKEGDFESKGNASLTADFKYMVGQKDSLTYNGKLTVKDCEVNGLPFIKTVTNATGKISISEQLLKVDQLQGQTYDCPVFLNGYLKDYQNPYIDFHVTIDFDLSKLKYILPQGVQDNLKGFQTSGKSEITAQLKGFIAKLDVPLEFKADSSIINGKIQVPYLQQPLLGVSGDVSVDNNKLIWKDIKFKYSNYNISSSGSIVDFNNPYVDLSILSNELNLSTNFNIKQSSDGQRGKTIFLNKLEGSFLNSNFSFLGNILDFQDPLLNIYGSVKLDLAGIRPVLPKQLQQLFGSLNITGVCDASAILNGRWKDWQNWDLIIKAQSPQISASGFKLSNVYIDYRMKDRFVYLREMTAAPYEGIFLATASLNLESPDNPYLINVEVKDVNLQLLKQDTALAKKNISGLLNIKAALNGYGAGLDKLKGSGWLYVKDGWLWEVPLLRGIVDLLFLPGFEKIVFKDAVGSFLIQDKNIYTSDFQLISNEVVLLWEGRLGFDKTLDFSVTAQLTEEFVAKSTTLGKITTAILGQAGRFVDMKLTGTLAQPKYTMVPFPVGRLLEKEVIKKIKDVFGDIFE